MPPTYLVTFALASLALAVHGRRLWKSVQVSSKRPQQAFTDLLTTGAAFNPSITGVHLAARKPTLSRGSVVGMKDSPKAARKGPKWDRLLREFYGLGLPVGGDELNHLISKLESESADEQEPSSARRKDSLDPQMSALAPPKAPPKMKVKTSLQASKLQRLLREVYGPGLLFGGKELDNLVTKLESEVAQQAQYCGFDIIETKNNVDAIARELEKRVKTTRPLRIHWTDCPNSCGQVQAADIGLMGGPAKKRNAEGKLKAVAGCKIFVGGKIGEQGHLSLDPYVEGIPLDWEDLIPTLADIIVKKFGGEVYPEYSQQQEAWAVAKDQNAEQ